MSLKNVKFVIISILLLNVLAACGSNAESNNKSNNNDESVGINMGNEDNDANDEEEIESDADEPVDESEDGMQIFDIGRTALIERSNDVKYEVTVDDFELLKDFNGDNIKDLIVNASDKHRISVVSYTIKNVGSIDLVPDEETVIHFAKEGDLAG